MSVAVRSGPAADSGEAAAAAGLLRRHLDAKLKDCSESASRFAEILLRISNVQKVAAFKRETLCTIETFNLMQPHPFTMEISKKYPDVSFF